MSKRTVLAFLLLAAACTFERDPNRVYTITGQDLGTNENQTISLTESKVSFVGTDDPVRSRQFQKLSDRYKEIVTLKNGATLSYGHLYTSGFISRYSDDERLEQQVAVKFYKDRGISFARDLVKHSGQWAYFVQSSASDTCFVFQSTFGAAQGEARVGSPGNQEAYGGVCYPFSARTVTTLEAEMLDYLQRIRFDDGAIHRTRIATVEAKATTASALPPGWITDSRTGCKFWNAVPRPNETISWSGDCSDGLGQGAGVAQWFADGKPSYRYEGPYRDGKMEGRGASQWANGSRYEGEYRDNLRNGTGTMTWASGTRYEGEWRDGKQDGTGAKTWASGNHYEGQWRDGKAEGTGRLTTTANGTFEGMWKNGCFRDGNRRAWVDVDASSCP
jgi:hypothetical protein